MRHILPHWQIVFPVLVLIGPSPAWALPYTFALFDVPGATDTRAFGLNDRGQIVGDYSDTSGHGFLYFGGAFSAINAPGGGQTGAFGIDQRGHIVGTSVDLAGFRGFRDRNGHFSFIDVPGNSGGTETFGINGRGAVVGLYFTDSGRQAHGFLDRRGHFTTIDFPGAAQTQLDGINRFGQIVGAYLQTDQSLPQAFLYRRGSFQLLQPPGATRSAPFGINNHGQIVGDFSDANGSHGFLYTGNSFLTIDVPGFEGRTFTRGIDENGDIVGFVQDQAGDFEAYVGTPTPEPTTLLLWGATLTGFGLARWRRHRQN